MAWAGHETEVEETLRKESETESPAGTYGQDFDERVDTRVPSLTYGYLPNSFLI